MRKPTQEQRVHAPSAPPSTPPQGGGGGGGFPWGKVLAGCGCLTLLLMFCAGGVVFLSLIHI